MSCLCSLKGPGELFLQDRATGNYAFFSFDNASGWDLTAEVDEKSQTNYLDPAFAPCATDTTISSIKFTGTGYSFCPKVADVVLQGRTAETVAGAQPGVGYAAHAKQFIGLHPLPDVNEAIVVKNQPDSFTTWPAATAVTVGTLVSDGATGHFACTVAGTTGGTEPTWSSQAAVGDTLTDGTVTWQRMSTAVVTHGATDYRVTFSGLYIYGSGNVVDSPAVGVPSIFVTYTGLATSVTQALTDFGVREYRAVLDVRNTAIPGAPPRRLTIHRLKPDIFTSFPQMGDEFQEFPFSGSVLAAPEITATDISKYFEISATTPAQTV